MHGSSQTGDLTGVLVQVVRVRIVLKPAALYTTGDVLIRDFSKSQGACAGLLAVMALVDVLHDGMPSAWGSLSPTMTLP